jgi:hypothetical protein
MAFFLADVVPIVNCIHSNAGCRVFFKIGELYKQILDPDVLRYSDSLLASFEYFQNRIFIIVPYNQRTAMREGWLALR